MADTYKIVYDDGAIQTDATYFNPSEISLSYKLQEDEIYKRIEIDGVVEFFGDDFDYIVNEKDVYQNANIQGFFYINDVYLCDIRLYLASDSSYDYDNKRCKLNITVHDDYTYLLNNKDEDYDFIADLDENTYNVKSLLDSGELEFLQGDSSDQEDSGFTENDNLGSLWCDLSAYVDDAYIYARISKEVSDVEVDFYVGTYGWELKDGTTNTLIRDWVDYYSEGVYTFPAAETDNISVKIWQKNFASLPDINDKKDILYNYDISTFLTGDSGLKTNNTWYLAIDELVYGNTEVSYTRCRKFIEVIKGTIQNAYSEIDFDETGTSTDSFAPFNDKDEDWGTLMIEVTSDAVLTTDDDGYVIEKTNPATQSKLTFKKLTDYIKVKFGIYYDVDESKILRFYRYEDVFDRSEISNPNNDLTTKDGVNWTLDSNKETFGSTNKKYHLLKRSETAGSADFIGVDVKFYNVIPEYVKEISISNFFHDLNDMEQVPGNYPNSIDKFMLFTAEKNNDEILTTWTNSALNYASPVNGESASGEESYVSSDDNTFTSRSGELAYIYSDEFFASVGNNITVNLTVDDSTSVIVTLVKDLDVVDDDISDVSPKRKHTFTFTSNSIDETFEIEERGDYVLVFIITTNDQTRTIYADASITNDSNYDIKTGTGALSGISDLKNIALSIANMDEYFILASSTSARVNGSGTTLSSNWLTEFESINLQTSTIDFVDEFSFEEYVKTDNSSLYKLQSVTKKAFSNIVDIELKK